MNIFPAKLSGGGGKSASQVEVFSGIHLATKLKIWQKRASPYDKSLFWCEAYNTDWLWYAKPEKSGIHFRHFVTASRGLLRMWNIGFTILLDNQIVAGLLVCSILLGRNLSLWKLELYIPHMLVFPHHLFLALNHCSPFSGRKVWGGEQGGTHI